MDSPSSTLHAAADESEERALVDVGVEVELPDVENPIRWQRSVPLWGFVEDEMIQRRVMWDGTTYCGSFWLGCLLRHPICACMCRHPKDPIPFAQHAAMFLLWLSSTYGTAVLFTNTLEPCSRKGATLTTPPTQPCDASTIDAGLEFLAVLLASIVTMVLYELCVRAIPSFGRGLMSGSSIECALAVIVEVTVCNLINSSPSEPSKKAEGINSGAQEMVGEESGEGAGAGARKDDKSTSSSPLPPTTAPRERDSGGRGEPWDRVHDESRGARCVGVVLESGGSRSASEPKPGPQCTTNDELMMQVEKLKSQRNDRTCQEVVGALVALIVAACIFFPSVLIGAGLGGAYVFERLSAWGFTVLLSPTIIFLPINALAVGYDRLQKPAPPIPQLSLLSVILAISRPIFHSLPQSTSQLPHPPPLPFFLWPYAPPFLATFLGFPTRQEIETATTNPLTLPLVASPAPLATLQIDSGLGWFPGYEKSPTPPHHVEQEHEVVEERGRRWDSV